MAALKHDPVTSPYSIQANIKNSEVILTRNVDNLRTKKKAAQNAVEIFAISTVNNKINLLPSDRKISSQEIKNAINNVIFTHPFLNKTKIAVDVNENTVTLNGEVSNFQTIAEIIELVSKTKGVLEIKNNLKAKSEDIYIGEFYSAFPDHYTPAVIPYGKVVKNDNLLENNIEEEMFLNPFIDPKLIKIEVLSGVVTLNGKVNSDKSRKEAIKSAYEGDAVFVKDNLKIVSLAR